MTIADDVEAIVLDSCYKDTPIDMFVHRLACPVESHPGYRLAEKHLPECVDRRTMSQHLSTAQPAPRYRR